MIEAAPTALALEDGEAIRETRRDLTLDETRPVVVRYVAAARNVAAEVELVSEPGALASLRRSSSDLGHASEAE